MAKPKVKSTLTPEQALALAGSAPAKKSGAFRVVILGGGFAGVFTAKYLTKLIGRRRDVEVELLNDENYFVFQPLLPEVAAGGISPTHVVNPIRELAPGAKFRLCKVRSIDFSTRRVLVSQGEGLDLVGVPYDYLVFCLGKVTSFASMPGVAEHALPLKNLSDAFRLRNHVLRCLELAAIESDTERRRALLSFVVAGGGFSGVETVGELWELVTRSLHYFPDIARDEVSFSLIHSQARILPEMPEKLGEAARRVLEKRGVALVLGARVRAASPDRVHLGDGRALPTRTFVCTVGNATNPIVSHAIRDGGFEEAQNGGRGIGAFATDETLRCRGKALYFAVGDCAGVPNPNGAGLCPPTAQFALRQAKTCAKNVLAAIDDRPLEAFRFRALGMLASLGNRSAVADMLGVRFSGFLAWFAWRSVYLMKLPGLVRRLRVALDWTLDLFFPRDITQLDAYRLDRLTVKHYEPGELIVREGEIGRELFVVMSGEVEVLGSGDGASNVVATLGNRDVFGERALLEDMRRTATVRAKTPVEVLVMNRTDFRSMVEHFPMLGEYFDGLMRSRYPKELPAAPLAESVRPD